MDVPACTVPETLPRLRAALSDARMNADDVDRALGLLRRQKSDLVVIGMLFTAPNGEHGHPCL